MRVGYITYGLDRAPTGIGRYAVDLVRALAALPAAPEVVLLTTEQKDTHALWPMFEHHRLSGCRLLPLLITRGHIEIARAAARYHLDLIHDPNGILPFLAPRRRTRRVATIHDAFAYVYPQTHNRLDTWRYRWMLPHAVRRVDRVLTDSLCSQRDIQRFLHVPDAQIQTIPCAVDPYFVPIPDSPERRTLLQTYGIKPPYLFYVGGITARKNISRLLEAFAQLAPTYPDLTLVIGGKRQWQTSEIDETFAHLNVGGRVHFTGYVADADLPALYSAARAFVFPSLYEGFGLPPLEAMACGTPVVCSNVSSLPEVVGDAALTVDPYDVSGLASAIERLLIDDGLHTMMAERGLARAAQFSWQQTAEQTLAAYHRVVAEGSMA